MIRKATMADVQAIYALLHHFADKGLLLGRSYSSLYDQLRDFQVVMSEDGRRLIGCGALHISWDNLAEIRSLAVVEEEQGKGVGGRLVESFLAEARSFEISKVFTLTYQPRFFSRLGFEPIDKGQLPHKVWSDCVHCPKFPDCNEEAMIWQAK
ncbi:MAG: N-acetyltransferase [Desulfurivibrionaceae bacterium]|nr:N-acetyltransferase [Desulfurivibrionaceae bacterium]